MSRTPAPKVRLSLEFRAQSWSLVQVSSQAGAQSAETFADFVDQVGKPAETFLKSDGTVNISFGFAADDGVRQVCIYTPA